MPVQVVSIHKQKSLLQEGRKRLPMLRCVRVHLGEQLSGCAVVLGLLIGVLIGRGWGCTRLGAQITHTVL